MIYIYPFSNEYIDTTHRILLDEDLRKLFLLNRKIGYEDNKKFWESYLLNPNNNKVFAILEDSEHIGNCGLKNINNNCAEFWIYLEKKYWGLGYGNIVMKKLIENNFFRNDLDEVYAFVDIINKISISLFEKNGFHKKDKVRINDNTVIKMTLKR